MTRVECDPGICGNSCIIDVTRVSNPDVVKADKRKVRLKINSDCERVAGMTNELTEIDEGEVDEWAPIKPRGESKICQYARQHRFCAACPVPSAILKAVEVEAGLAIPRDAHIKFVSTERH